MSEISNKELEMLRFLAELEMTEMKKYSYYSKICTDPQIKIKSEQIAAKHKIHYDKLVSMSKNNQE